MTKKIGINGVVRDMTPEEETAFDASCDITKARDEEKRLAQEAIDTQIATDKASAKAKLIAGEPLTEDEANTIVL